VSGAEADRGEAVRLAGVVREVSSPPPTVWELQPEDGKAERREQAGWLTVEVDGRAVRVETDAAWLVGDGTTDKGAWRDLDAQAGGRFGAGQAPFTKAKLRVVALAVGDPVEVYGEVVERRFDDDGAFREAPTASLGRVRGLVVARGADATAELTRAIARRYPPAQRPAAAKPPDPRLGDPGSPRHRPPPIEWAWSGGLVAGAILAAAFWHASVAIGLVASAILVRPERTQRVYRARDQHHAGSHAFRRILLPILYVGTIGGFLGVSGPLAYTIATAAFLAIALALEVSLLGVVSQHRRLVVTPAWKGELGVHALVAGTVRDPTPVTVGHTASAMAREAAIEQGSGSDPDVVKWTRFHAEGTFLVDAPAGVVEVAPDELAWASTVVVAPDTSRRSYEVVELIPIGGKVAAAGWIEAAPDGGPPRLRSRGTKPAVLLATSALGDPRALANRMIWHRRLTLLGLVAAAAVLGLLIALP
jgi:hypothetical protein